MTPAIYGVYGAGGYGREVMPLARAQLQRKGVDPEHLYVVDDGCPQRELNGHRVVAYEEFLTISADERFVAIAIASGSVRESLSLKCKADGVHPWRIIAENVVILDDAEIGEGTILNPFVTITANTRIGRHVHANLYTYVAHDCRIGDFVTFAPCVKCNGNIVIEDHAYIGTGAILKQGRSEQPLTVGRGAVVGMGAVVTKDVAPGATVIGNPARPLKAKQVG